jgi:hypothetical protein
VLEPVTEFRHTCADVRARQIAKQPLELGPHGMPPKRLAAMMPCPAPQARPVVDLLLERAQVRRNEACVVLAHGEVETARGDLGCLGERVQIPVDIARHRQRQRRGHRPVHGQEHRHEPAAGADALNNGESSFT